MTSTQPLPHTYSIHCHSTAESLLKDGEILSVICTILSSENFTKIEKLLHSFHAGKGQTMPHNRGLGQAGPVGPGSGHLARDPLLSAPVKPPLKAFMNSKESRWLTGLTECSGHIRAHVRKPQITQVGCLTSRQLLLPGKQFISQRRRLGTHITVIQSTLPGQR